MSSGHLRYEEKPKAELFSILGERDTAERFAKPVKVNTLHDWPYVGGTSIDGKTVYIDHVFCNEVKSGRLACKGMTADQIIQAIIEHEHSEKAIEDGDNAVDAYPAAHELATTAEHDFVEKLGVDPDRYEAALKPAIERCLNRKALNPPPDAWCGPILDDMNAQDKRIIENLKAKGVEDAHKLSKVDVHYGYGASRCEDCAMYQKPDAELSKCDLVSGLVRDNRSCDRWTKR